MRVVFRADASIRIGTGHVMRCLALADELTLQGHHCRFVCREHEGHLGGLIANKGYELHLLPCSRSAETQPSGSAGNPHADWLGVPWQHDAEQTLEVLSSLEADWLVVDHYALDARWERQVAKAVTRIMVIDDLADRNHECTLLLDQNLGRDVSDYDRLVPKDCLRLIGPEYALLRPEFAQLRERSLQRRKHPELKRILISLGGVDKTNVTGHVLDALANTPLPADTELDIIMGASAPYLDKVRQQVELLPFKATVNVNVSDMAERMCLADLSIGAAGSTSWERCCLGLPSIIVILAENQRLIGEALERKKCTRIIHENAVDKDFVRLIVELKDFDFHLSTLSENAARICNGGGCTRIVSAMARSSYL